MSETIAARRIAPWLVYAIIAAVCWGVWGVLSKGPSRQLSGWMTQLLFTFALIPSAAIAAWSRRLKTGTDRRRGLFWALDQQTSNLFYQVVSTRHSHKRSTLITTNSAFSEWGNILYNTTIATAIVDRLVENSEIFLLGGDSLRKAKNAPASPAE
jgi:hypothetical protein